MTRALFFLLLLPACPNSPARQDTTPVEVRAETKELPRRTDALDTLFGPELTRWIVELSNSPASATRPPLPPQPDLGPKTRKALVALFEQVEIAASHTDEEPPELGTVTEAVNMALRSEGRGYAVDTVLVPTENQTASHFVLVFSFTVDRERVYIDESGLRHRVRRVRRLDQIGYRYRVLGFANEGRAPMVLLGSIDSMLVGDVLGHVSIGGDSLWRSGCRGRCGGLHPRCRKRRRDSCEPGCSASDVASAMESDSRGSWSRAQRTDWPLAAARLDRRARQARRQ